MKAQKKVHDGRIKARIKIIERTFSIMRGSKKIRRVTQLHYLHWPDHKQAPDLKALNTLIKRRMKLLRNSNRPLVINCQGGKGRTGIVALLECCRNEVENQKAKGVPIKKTVLNVAEMIYMMRKFRPKLIEGVSQLSQACRYVAHYIK